MSHGADCDGCGRTHYGLCDVYGERDKLRAEVSRLQAERDDLAADLNVLEGEREKDAGKIAEYEQLRDENDRLLSALKAEAMRVGEIGDLVVVGGIPFQIGCDDDGENVTAEEVES